MTVEEHFAALNAAIRAEHEEQVAEIQRRADEAAAEGDEPRRLRYLAQIARLEALPKPWETSRSV